jgi:hypothetical protein
MTRNKLLWKISMSHFVFVSNLWSLYIYIYIYSFGNIMVFSIMISNIYSFGNIMVFSIMISKITSLKRTRNGSLIFFRVIYSWSYIYIYDSLAGQMANTEAIASHSTWSRGKGPMYLTYSSTSHSPCIWT